MPMNEIITATDMHHGEADKEVYINVYIEWNLSYIYSYVYASI